MLCDTPYFTNAKEGYVPAALPKGHSVGRRWRLVQNVLLYGVPMALKLIGVVLMAILRELLRAVLPAQEKSLRGQVALVTGGANGLGRAFCLCLAQEGCHVAVVDIDQASAERTTKEVRLLGVKAEAFQADIASYEAVQGLRKEVEQRLGPVDILVNNAGLLAVLSLSEGTPEDLERIIRVNLLAHFWTVRVFLEGMKERRRGHVVAVSSALGYLPIGRCISYVSTKYGVRGMMQSLQHELASDGLAEVIGTTTVYPTVISTRQEFMDMLKSLSVLHKLPVYTPEQVAHMAVTGLKRNASRVIAAPWYAVLFAPLYELVPTSITRAIMDVYIGKMPRLMK